MTRVLAVLALALLVAAAPPSRPVSFRHDVYPLLKQHCLRCHQGHNPTSGVRLDVRSEILGESNGRALAMPGQGAASRLVQAIDGRLEDRQMPPPGRGKRLSPEQVRLLGTWIDQGLAWDDTLLPPPTPPPHWAYQPIRRPVVPRTNPATTTVYTPVDAFLAEARQKAGIVPVAEASRGTLIRRLYLDLLGLPPTPEQITSFECDPRPDAHERLVERLLASPQHGERYARHWLDVARHADSEGYESNHLRLHAWRYRDWVVAAFNRDIPFADFVTLQIAGDEVRPARDENLIATGFLAGARLSSNEEDRARQRNDILVDVVNTTTSAFLGLTMHCAQCHNHKFDPLTARDYYRFQAFFVRGQPANLALRAPELVSTWRAGLPPGYEAAWARRLSLFEQARQRLVTSTRRTLPAAQRRALDQPSDRRSDEEERLARLAELRLQFSTGRIEREIPPDQREEYATLQKQLATWDRSVPERPQTFAFHAPSTASAGWQVLPMKGFYPLLHEPDRLARLRGHLLVAGDVHQRGPALEPGWPAVFGPTPGVLTPTPRLALSAWLTRGDNPLVARVWANRVWQWHFGTGLVSTPGDFGIKGARPSHPELLDWLASEFLASGGSTKHLHRLIVASHAYRLASSPRASTLSLDPDDRLLWRWKPRRLEAEVLRDRLLAVSGELDLRGGGPGDTDESASRRRGLYLFHRRDHPSMVQGLFDGPTASAESCPRRGVSTVPLQALYFLNNRFVHARAATLAGRVETLAGADPEQRIRTAFRLALGRLPDVRERQAAGRFLDRHGEEGWLPALCQALVSLNEFVYLE